MSMIEIASERLADALKRYDGLDVRPHMIERSGLSIPTSGRSAIVERAVLETGERGKTYRWLITTDQIDRTNDRMDPRGMDIKRFMDNPVIPWGHDYNERPIGKAVAPPQVVVTADGRRAVLLELEFHDKTDLAIEVASLVDAGYLKTGSIGFIPLAWHDEDASRYPGAYPFASTVRTFDRWELLEFSICTIPMNPGALIQNALGVDAETEKQLRAAIEAGTIPSDGQIVKRVLGASRIPDIVTTPTPMTTTLTIDDATRVIAAMSGASEEDVRKSVDTLIASLSTEPVNNPVLTKGMLGSIDESMTMAAIDTLHQRLYWKLYDFICCDKRPVPERMPELAMLFDEFRDKALYVIAALLEDDSEEGMEMIGLALKALAQIPGAEQKKGRVIRQELYDDIKEAHTRLGKVLTAASDGEISEAEAEDIGSKDADSGAVQTKSGGTSNAPQLEALITEITEIRSDIKTIRDALDPLNHVDAATEADATTITEPTVVKAESTTTTHVIPFDDSLALKTLSKFI